MASIGNNVFDKGLEYLQTNGTRLDICSTEPTTYTEATVTYTLGHKDTPTLTGPADRAGGGREVTVSAITDGDVTGTDTAAYWAISYVVGTELLVAGSLSAGQVVTDGNVFTLTEFKVGFPDPA